MGVVKEDMKLVAVRGVEGWVEPGDWLGRPSRHRANCLCGLMASFSSDYSAVWRANQS